MDEITGPFMLNQFYNCKGNLYLCDGFKNHCAKDFENMSGNGQLINVCLGYYIRYWITDPIITVYFNMQSPVLYYIFV